MQTHGISRVAQRLKASPSQTSDRAGSAGHAQHAYQAEDRANDAEHQARGSQAGLAAGTLAAHDAKDYAQDRQDKGEVAHHRDEGTDDAQDAAHEGGDGEALGVVAGRLIVVHFSHFHNPLYLNSMAIIIIQPPE